MNDRVTIAGLGVARILYEFVQDEVLPGLDQDPAALWQGFADLLAELAPRNAQALARRDSLQAEIDGWYRARRGAAMDGAAQRAFLARIGYLHGEAPARPITTGAVDPEIATLAGPQLVVPLSNARYALNAANARWGSLYDALYGTDALGQAPPPGGLDPARADSVVAYARALLDRVVPLARMSHGAVDRYAVHDRALVAHGGTAVARLADPGQFAGYRGAADAPHSVLLCRHGLHLELVLDRDHPIGARDRAGLADIVLESAISAIMDAEDSVAAVDAEDKVGVYRNWLGLMRGTLSAGFEKNGRWHERRLSPDRAYLAPDGTARTLPGRSLLLVRNVGHHMMTDAVLGPDGGEIPETFLDALITALIGLHDRVGPQAGHNSRAGSIYIVKPKLHGPDEVALADALFARVEHILGLPAATLKMGIMDEERRSSANLGACIAAACGRVVFINTGFLDRTGDEIHTAMEAGPCLPKAGIRSAQWLAAYEARNVAIGLAAGLAGRAQIGKGMWAAPDRMGDMLAQKIAHPRAGASTAWVPSPTAATLHALHYLEVDVEAVQRSLQGVPAEGLERLLTPPILPATQSLTEAAIEAELANNCQGILGYVVRWVDQGIGCSKVPDLHEIGLMEDRATLRISSQHIANWLHHGIVSPAQVEAALRRMALLVDRQNASDPAYTPLGPAYDGPAFAAAHDLIFQGRAQPCGYTEFILTARRRQAKSGHV